MSRCLEDLEEARRALAAADAHRHDAPLGLAALAFEQEVADAARARHAEGVADRDRAAVDVVLLGVDAEGVAAVEALAREGFVELPEVDVVDLEAGALEQLRHGVDRADAHLVGLAARDREAAEGAEGLDAALLGFAGLHHHDRGRTVRKLRGVAGRDVLVLAADRLQLRQALERRGRSVALVLRDGVVDFEVSPVSLSFTIIVVSIGTISSSKSPASWAAAVRIWLSREYSSWYSRLTL